jgi:hypothetical protein
VLIYDRVKGKTTAMHLFGAEKGQIQCLKYGPYDNGHIVAGFANGSVAILDSISLEKLFDKDLFIEKTTPGTKSKGVPVAKISFDPTNLLLVSSEVGEVVAISLVESKVKYTYLDLGREQYCTVQLKQGQAS